MYGLMYVCNLTNKRQVFVKYERVCRSFQRKASTQIYITALFRKIRTVKFKCRPMIGFLKLPSIILYDISGLNTDWRRGFASKTDSATIRLHS